MSQLNSTIQANSRVKAPRNRTIELKASERKKLQKRLVNLNSPAGLNGLKNSTICGDMLDIVPHIPDKRFDLLFLDPPYNLTKSFNGKKFNSLSLYGYEKLLDEWVKALVRILKSTASVYICGDWRSSAAIYNVCNRYFKVQNRITWEREKGRAAKRNWKNCTEDIWYCTVSDKFTFNLDRVKLKRTVIAPYRDKNGFPKDWDDSISGKFRTTAPSNIWTDITIPFWSMPENTIHPTQKPEKLLAKIILASSNENDLVLDPFVGSGTTSVVAKKLGRNYVGIERDLEFCLLTEKRLKMAEDDMSIQGYQDMIFWERNSLNRSSIK